jgi:HSP20 family protein
MTGIVRWEDPFAGLTSLHSQIDDMFNDFFNSSRHLPALSNLPAMDVYNEGDKQLVAEVQLPGFGKDDVEVSVHNGMLEIKGEKHEKEEDKDKERTYMMRESSASFYRRVVLPKHADGDSVEAHFENGMLKVIVPFKELPKPKRVQIHSGKPDKK